MRSIIRTYCKFHDSIQHFQINVYIINALQLVARAYTRDA